MSSTSPTASGRRARKKGLTRQAILDAALEHFGARGIYQTRLEDITESADIAKGAFYTYFESKTALVAELLARGVGLLDQHYLAPLDDAGTVAERVRLLVRQHNAFFDDHPRYQVVFHQARGLLPFIPHDENRLPEVFADYLDRLGRRLGGLGEASLGPDAVRGISAALAGAIAGTRSFGPTARSPESSRLVEELLTAGLPALLDFGVGGDAP